MQIRVIEGEGAIQGAGAKAARPIVIEIADETGKPVDGAAVSFRMPEEGPGATFARGMRTDIRITTPDGRAAIYDFLMGRLVGPYQVRVTAVKGQIRAGTVVSQYVSDSPVKAKSMRSGKGGSRKWIYIAVAAGAGAAAAVAAGGMSQGRTSSSPAAGPPVAPPQIGTPSISVGGPQ